MGLWPILAVAVTSLQLVPLRQVASRRDRFLYPQRGERLAADSNHAIRTSRIRPRERFNPESCQRPDLSRLGARSNQTVQTFANSGILGRAPTFGSQDTFFSTPTAMCVLTLLRARLCIWLHFPHRVPIGFEIVMTPSESCLEKTGTGGNGQAASAITNK